MVHLKKKIVFDGNNKLLKECHFVFILLLYLLWKKYSLKIFWADKLFKKYMSIKGALFTRNGHPSKKVLK